MPKFHTSSSTEDAPHSTFEATLCGERRGCWSPLVATTNDLVFRNTEWVRKYLGTLTLMQFWFQTVPCLLFWKRQQNWTGWGAIQCENCWEIWENHQLFVLDCGFPTTFMCWVCATSLLPLSLEAFAVPAARDTEIEDEEVLFFLQKKQLFSVFR